MPDSIESFVKKLQEEGVNAGKKAAEEIKNSAKREADDIIANAKTRADQILVKAKTDADNQFSRMKTELELAARDTVLKLRETIGQVFSSMLSQKIEKHLSDPDFLRQIIREVIITYAKADAAQPNNMKINISDKIGENIYDDMLKHLFQNLNEEQDKIVLQRSLSKAGFEYTIDGATVEVSPDSISELISDMVGPGLQEILDHSIGKKK